MGSNVYSTQEQEEALYDSKGEIVRVGIYEVDCTHMQTSNKPLVGQISEITRLAVRLRFPGFESARSFVNTEIRMGRQYPNLDDYCDVSKDKVSLVLIRRVGMEEYGERKHLLNFWLAKSNIRPQPLFTSMKYADQINSGTVPIAIGMKKKHSMKLMNTSMKYADQINSGTVPIAIGMKKKHSMELMNKGNKKQSSSSSSMISDQFEAMKIEEKPLEVCKQ